MRYTCDTYPEAVRIANSIKADWKEVEIVRVHDIYIVVAEKYIGGLR
jgi:hypothetical protein